MFAEDAVVLYAFHAGFSRACNCLFVNDSILQPQIRNPESNNIIDDRRNICRCAKHVDQVDASLGLALGRSLRCLEIWIALESVDLTERRVYWKHRVPLAGQIAPDVMAGAPRLIAPPYDGDRPSRMQQFFDDVWIIHF